MAFCREFVSGAKELSATAKWLWTAVLFFLPLIGWTVAQFTDWLRGVIDKPWSFCLLFPPVAWASARAGSALDRIVGPVIEEGRLLPDQENRVFRMWVRNAGSGEVVAHVYVTALAGSSRITSEVETYWMGLDGKDPVRLAGNKRDIAGVLSVQRVGDGHPQVCVAARPKEGREPSLVPLCDAVPLSQQKELRLDVRICLESEGRFVKDKIKTIDVVPAEGSPLHYDIRPVSGFRTVVRYVKGFVRYVKGVLTRSH
jgi:hypothetical protein